MQLMKFFDDVYRLKRLQGRSQNTTRLYRFSINNFGRTLERIANLSDLNDDNVAKHMQRMLDEGAAKPTVNKDRAQLLCIWRYACKKNYLSTWPDIPKLVEPERIPIAWLQEEILSLYKTFQTLDRNYLGIKESLWWTTVFNVCLESGERIGAIMAAKWTDLRGEWIFIKAEDRKGGLKDMAYRLTPNTLALMEELRKTSYDKISIFPWPYSHTYRWYRLGQILNAAGLPNTAKTKFHCLRKTFASVIDSKGLSAQKLLGHKHAETTELYLDPRFSEASATPAYVVADWLRL